MNELGNHKRDVILPGWSVGHSKGGQEPKIYDSVAFLIPFTFRRNGRRVREHLQKTWLFISRELCCMWTLLNPEIESFKEKAIWGEGKRSPIGHVENHHCHLVSGEEKLPPPPPLTSKSPVTKIVFRLLLFRGIGNYWLCDCFQIAF